MQTLETYLIGGALMLILSILASKAMGRTGIPALLAFVAVGMLAGSEGIGGIYFDNAQAAQVMGVISLVFILFSGGLDTEVKALRPVFAYGLLLSTLGVIFTGMITAVLVQTLLDFTWAEAFLMGAIVSSTDAAAVFSILRAKGVNLKGSLKPLLEFESASNDPMAVFLTIGLLEIIRHPDIGWSMLLPLFIQQMTVGAVIGYVIGKGLVFFLNRLQLEYEGLYPVLTIAAVLLTYGFAQILGGNGFLAVYLAGIMLAQENFIHKKSLTLFHDGLAWLMQIAMFLTLGLLVFPSKLLGVTIIGLSLSLFLIFIARPLSVFLVLIKSPFNAREKIMLSWVGLRGAVPIILATYVLLADIEKADTIFNLVFFIVLSSVLLQGTTIGLLAKLLRLAGRPRKRFRYPMQYLPESDMKNDLFEIEVPEDAAVVGKTIIQIQLPKNTLVVLIQRKNGVIVPNGSTQVEADDTLLVLAENEVLSQVKEIIQGSTVS